MVSSILDFVILILIGAGVAWIMYRSFMRPSGVYMRSLAGFLIATGSIVGLAVLASPFISDAAGLGVFFIICALIAFSAAVSLLAVLAATLRHAWDLATGV